MLHAGKNPDAMLSPITPPTLTLETRPTGVVSAICTQLEDGFAHRQMFRPYCWFTCSPGTLDYPVETTLYPKP